MREVLIFLFKLIDERSKYLNELKDKVSPIDFDLEESEDEDILYDIGKKVILLGRDIIQNINKLRKITPIFD